MNRTEHLLTILSEECAEVAQRNSKAIRFTLEETQPGQPLTNAERIQYEFGDLIATYEILIEQGLLEWPSQTAIFLKKAKIEKFLEYSQQRGTLE